ncbi:MAG: ribokinase [Lachnospiraceae bacterium]|nr:ribokinase [Lachnospiraceae bacterium]MBR0153181.1 ribokinase [Lachnospiraceae bacterium]
MRILNFGSTNIDMTFTLDHIVQPGETISSYGMEIHPGGKGLNQSVALAKAGAEVYHGGLIGNDGAFLRKTMLDAGVNCDYLYDSEGPNGNALIQVDRNGQNCIVLFGGSNDQVTEELADEILSHFGAGDWLLLQNEINLDAYIIDRAYEKGMVIVLNPSPYNEKMEKCDLKKVSYFLMNEVEGGQITGKTEPKEILAEALRRFPEAKIVLTLGGDGCCYQDAEQYCEQGIFPVKAVDTTAAGDTFTGYFLASVMRGEPVARALKLASKASSIAVTRPGASPSIPAAEEVVI